MATFFVCDLLDFCTCVLPTKPFKNGTFFDDRRLYFRTQLPVMFFGREVANLIPNYLTVIMEKQLCYVIACMWESQRENGALVF